MINLDIPDPTDQNCVADWIELSVSYESAPLAKAAVKRKIELASGTEPSDAFMSSIWDELETREQLYGEHPPFIVDKMEVSPNMNWIDNPEYIMCLILSLTGNPSQPTPTGKLFERLSKDAIKNYLNGDAIVTGHPATHSIVDICHRTFEGFKMELPANYNDRGVDVIAWKSFQDNRGNQIIVLMQCAGGKNWLTKTGDVVERAWKEKYMTFRCPPIRGFSTAVVVSNRENFEEVSFELDLLFDRPRIIRNTFSYLLDGNLREEIRQWCDRRFLEILN